MSPADDEPNIRQPSQLQPLPFPSAPPSFPEHPARANQPRSSTPSEDTLHTPAMHRTTPPPATFVLPPAHALRSPRASAPIACASSSPPVPTAAATAASGFGSRVRGARYELTKTVLPADSDYSGALWHGAYVRWLEEARVRFFLEVGVDYAALVRDGRMELVVTALDLRYKAAARLGDVVTVRQRLDVGKSSRVRVVTVSEFVREKSGGGEEVLATAEVAVTPVSVDTGRVVRRWPDGFEGAMRVLFESESGGSPAWLARR
jgi:acyl-CoA thioester hydrolase